MNLEDYFDLNIPSIELYAKGAVIFGVHGIELINGEYFASHFHLKMSIAKGEMKRFIKDNEPKVLFNLAEKENSDFNQWPEVKYENDSYTIRKYKFTWLINHLNKNHVNR